MEARTVSDMNSFASSSITLLPTHSITVNVMNLLKPQNPSPVMCCFQQGHTSQAFLNSPSRGDQLLYEPMNITLIQTTMPTPCLTTSEACLSSPHQPRLFPHLRLSLAWLLDDSPSPLHLPPTLMGSLEVMRVWGKFLLSYKTHYIILTKLKLF